MTDELMFTPAIIGTVFLLGLYGAFKFAEQSWGTDPTKWSYIKYLQIFAAAVIVSALTYLATGILQPATIDQITQALALLGGSVLTILGYKTVKNVSSNGTVINPVVVKPTIMAPAAPVETEPDTSGSSGWQPDFSVTPTFNKVQSGTPITMYLETGAGDEGIHKCREIIIDWMDGSPLQNIPIVKGFAQVSHIYQYIAGSSQYDTHSFYPEFTTIDSYDGGKKSFNTDGRACEIEVVSLVPANPPGK